MRDLYYHQYGRHVCTPTEVVPEQSLTRGRVSSTRGNMALVYELKQGQVLVLA